MFALQTKHHIFKCTSESEWLAERMNGIGASDAPIVMGVSRFRSAYDLWAEKVRLVESPDLSEVEAVEWGKRLEAPILFAYAEKSGVKCCTWPSYYIVQHPLYEWMRCTPDAFSENGIVQIKTTSAYLAHEWEEEPPLQYQIQIQHEMEVTGAKQCTLVVLIGGQNLYWFDIKRDDEFIRKLKVAELDFWQLVQKEEPPEIDPADNSILTFEKLHPGDNGASIALHSFALLWDTKLTQIKNAQAKLKDRRAIFENKLKLAIGMNTYGVFSDGSGYSYKTQNIKHGTTRVLRRFERNE